MKEKVFIVFGIVLFLLLVGLVFYNLEYKEFVYYTQVDNTKIERLNTTDYMKYEYKLIAYDPNGKSKEVTFKTSRELRNEAFLKLTYRYISGVNHWEEISYDALSSKVQDKYKK